MYMKKIVLIFIVISFTNIVNAQSIKYNFGISSSNLKSIDQDTLNNANYNSLYALNIGVSSVNIVDDKLSLITDILFVQTGYVRTFSYNSWNGTENVLNKVESKNIENYIQFIQRINFSFTENLSISVGPYVDYILDGRTINQENSQPDPYPYVYSDNEIWLDAKYTDKLNYGINFSTSYKLNKYFDFTLGYNLTNILNSNSAAIYDSYGYIVRRKLNSLYINFAYIMQLKT